MVVESVADARTAYLPTSAELGIAGVGEEHIA
jgi:hypothetical protein